ncbi:transglutaminase domain-containing protein [Halogeometricum limi]|uniref:Transglutaminase-like enzyme, putative cysteine protease n=1 Tax=Halogeometricum limi TaxID=555875 RepID=A0A1I6IMY8_9EURY|nr:transglutaminase domain-containing protein [Halogeometricum limi]SFR67650.1 Transglutaminase-like enzyme, putative cysteine protease [Halogeometricum limi]
MADDRTTLDTGDGPSIARVVLVCCCVVAIVFSAALVAPLSTALDGVPAKSLVVLDAGRSGGESAGLGALSPTQRAPVGSDGSTGENPYRSLDSEVHFTVESDRPAYWRTGSYATYTDDGWRRTGETTPYDGDISPDARGDSVTYRVSLERDATALPTVWRPNTVTGIGGADPAVTTGRAVVVPSGVDAGTSYTAESTRPSREESVLRAAGTDYPSSLASRYTALPENAPPRVADLAANVTADADTPYEKAVAVERYLEANKGYSLSAGHDGGDPVSSFLFDMDEGYCEYFASSMAIMLRTQDVPARYVVGYSPGERTDEGEYTVRNMNAHAWVEVYFPDVGWVRFDPTPAEERRDAERRAYERQEGGSYRTAEPSESTAAETATPEATQTPSSTPTPEPTDTTEGDASTPTPDDAASTPTGPSSPEPVTISLDRDPVPGATVIVTVARGDSPAVGETVLFNGDPVGVTDEDGRVVASVPYASELTVSLASTDDQRASVRASRVGSAPVADGPSSVSYALDDPMLGVVPDERPTYPLQTNASLSFVGERVTNGEILVFATVADTPVVHGDVRVNGEQVAQTDSLGRAELTLPDSPGNVTVTVARGDVSGEGTFALDAFSVAVDRPSFPLPYTTATVRTRLGDDGVGGVPVSVDGERAVTTGPNGTATVTLPPASSVRIAAARYGQSSETTVSGMLSNAAALLGTLVVGVGAVLGGAYRRDWSLSAILARVGAVFDRLLAALVSGVRSTDVLVDGLRNAGRRVEALARGVVDRTVRVGELPGRFAAWVHACAETLRERGATATARVARRAGVADDPLDADARTIRDCWDEFRGHVSVPRQASRTPGELAAHAVSVDGLPAEPVAVVRDAFRDVEYGGRAPADRSAAVARALAEIRTAAESAEMSDSTDLTDSTERRSRDARETADTGPDADSAVTDE